MDILKNVAAVIRTWSNNEAISESVCRALKAGIGNVIVVVKDEDPKLYGAVERRLADEIALYPGRLHIITMRIGYGWSAALNAGFEEVRQLNEFALIEKTPAIEFVLNVSNEVQYSRRHVKRMLHDIQRTDSCGAVGTSFLGIADGKEVLLGATYEHIRNTMMLVRFRSYLEIGGYDRVCDHLGGMEDFDWLARLAAAHQHWSKLDMRVKLSVGVNYCQSGKEAREHAAIEKIADRRFQNAVKLCKVFLR
jgi:hypothetical protein